MRERIYGKYATQYTTQSYGFYLATILAIILMITGVQLLGAGKQIQLNNGMWQAVGFQGGYTADSGSLSYAGDVSFEFRDVADDNTTWVSYDMGEEDLRYNAPGGLTRTYGITNQVGGTIGLFAIHGQLSKTEKTTLDGGVENVVFMKAPSAKAYRGDIPQYRMYVEGRSGIPTIRIDYQGNHNGDMFRIKFGQEDDAYVSYFNYENTYDNPAVLINDKDVAGADVRGIPRPLIIETIDFNLTDNNLTRLYNDLEEKFRIKTRTGEINSVDFRLFSVDTGNRIEAYEMVNGLYNRFDTRNTLNGSNQFDRFTPGRGYWVKATSQQAHDDGNYTKVGLIVKDAPDIDEDYLYGNIENGWHMLSFGDMDLRYSPTGVFMDWTTIVALSSPNHSGLRLFFDRHGQLSADLPANDINISRGNYVDISISALSQPTGGGNPYGLAAIAQRINVASESSKMLYGENTNVRAFPVARSIRGNDLFANEGLVILSDQLFELNSSADGNITTLTGNRLRETARGTFSSVYGEFVLATDINNFTSYPLTGAAGGETTARSGLDINASIEINMPGYSAQGATITDLNDTNHSATLGLIQAGLERAATRAGTNAAQTAVQAYFIDIDMLGDSKDYPADRNTTDSIYISRNFTNSILLAAGSRFSITDKTEVRVYRFVDNGQFKLISGRTERAVDPGNYGSGDVAHTIAAINALTEQTGVRAFDIGRSGPVNNQHDYFMIVSNNGKAYLEEDYNYTLFKDIPLDSTDIPRDNRTLTRGFINNVYSHKQLLDMKLHMDTSLLDTNASWDKVIVDRNWTNDSNGTLEGSNNLARLSEDLQDNAIWALDFPISGSMINTFAKYNKEITSMVVQKFSSDNRNYYDFLDLTKDPTQWYGNVYDGDSAKRFDNDYQGIFRIFYSQSYWVQIKDKVATPSTDVMMKLPESKIVYTARAGFDNNLTDGVGVVENHISHTLKIQFKERFIDPLERDFYNVVAIIDGKKYYLRNEGKYFSLNIDDLEMGLKERKSTEANIPIFIQAYNSAGDVLKEDPNKERSQFSILFRKPPLPKLRWSKDGGLDITNRGIFKAEVYLGRISDIESERDKNKIAFDSVQDLLKDERLSWKGKGKAEADYGEVIPIRVVLKDPEYNLYSNMQGLLYAPLRSGHVLEVTPQKTRASVPYSYLQNQFLTALAPGKKGSEATPYNGRLGTRNVTADDKSGNGVDNGVQVDRLAAGAADQNIMFYYYPEGAESQKRLPAFGGGARTAYISVRSDNITLERAVISVTYISDYEGRIFYLYFNDKLYQGVFPNSDVFNSDGSAYDVSNGKLEVDSVFNSSTGQQTQQATASGFEIEMSSANVQPIVIPSTSNGGGGTPTPEPKPTPKPEPDPKPDTDKECGGLPC